MPNGQSDTRPMRTLAEPEDEIAEVEDGGVGSDVSTFSPIAEGPDGEEGFVADATVPITTAISVRGDIAESLDVIAEVVQIKAVLDKCAMFRRFNDSARTKLARLIFEYQGAGIVELRPLEVLIKYSGDEQSPDSTRGPGMYIFDLDKERKVTLLTGNSRGTDDRTLIATTFTKGHAEVVGEATGLGLPASSTVQHLAPHNAFALFIPADLISGLPADARAELLARGLEQREFLGDLNVQIAMSGAAVPSAEPYTLPTNGYPKEVLDWLMRSRYGVAAADAKIINYDSDLGGGNVAAKRYKEGEKIELIPGYIGLLRRGSIHVAENRTNEDSVDGIVVAKILEGNLIGEKIAVAKPGEGSNAATAKLIAAENNVEVAYIPLPKAKRGTENYDEIIEQRIAALRALHHSMTAKLRRAAEYRNSLRPAAVRRVGSRGHSVPRR